MVTTVMYMTTTNSQTINHKDTRLRFSAVGYMVTQDHWQAHSFLYVFMYATCIHTCKLLFKAIGMEVAKSVEAGSIYKEHCADEDSLGQGSHMQGKGTVSCDNQGEYLCQFYGKMFKSTVWPISIYHLKVYFRYFEGLIKKRNTH